MEGAPIFTPEDKPEKDSSDSKTEKKGSKAKDKSREIGSIIAGAEKTASDQGKKREVAEKTVPLLEKIFGPDKGAETKPGEADREKKPEPSEKLVEAPRLSAAEEHVADTLADGREIDLRGIAPERDETIIEQAVEIAEAKQSAMEAPKDFPVVSAPEFVEPEPAEMAEETQEIPTAEIPPETVMETAEDTTAEDEDEDDTVAAASGSTSSGSSATSASSTGASRTSGAAAGATGAAGAGSGGTRPPTPPNPPTPPTAPTPSGSPFPHRRYSPGAAYGAPSSPGSAYTAPAAASLAPTVPSATRAIEEAEHHAYNRGRNRGLVAGLIVGGGIEHIRHKRREKKMERKFASERKEQKKQVENLRWDQVREAEAAKIREAAAEKYRSIERTASIARPEVNRRLQTETAVEQNRRGDSEMAKQLEAERKETQRVLTKAEQIEQERQREQLELAEGHRMERSAWHNIEVDSHGKAVQETSFEYGHEYYKERARETAPKTQQAKQYIDGAAGEVALVAAALSDGYTAGQGQSSSHSGAVGTAAHTAQPQAAAASTPQANARQSIVKAVTTPPTTPGGTAAWFVALVVILAVVFFVAL